MKNNIKCFLAVCTVAIMPVATHAVIVLSGDVTTTGGTFTITEDINFDISTSSIAYALIFDDWVVNHNGVEHHISLTPNSLEYQINGGSVQTTTLSYLADNLGSTANDVSPNDGFIIFNIFAVTQGQTLTIKSGSWTTTGNASFNPEAIQTYTGEVFLMNESGVAISGTVVVPEPSTYAAFAGIAALGLAQWHRRRRTGAAG